MEGTTDRAVDEEFVACCVLILLALWRQEAVIFALLGWCKPLERCNYLDE